MTHQEMIDFWKNEIEKNESAAMFMSTFQQIYKYKDRAEYARMIYTQLCKMETNEPITITTINHLMSISSIDIDPEYAKAVNDNFWQLLSD